MNYKRGIIVLIDDNCAEKERALRESMDDFEKRVEREMSRAYMELMEKFYEEAP